MFFDYIMRTHSLLFVLSVSKKVKISLIEETRAYQRILRSLKTK